MSNQALLISIRPRFAKLIFAGTKRVELRRIRPRIGKGDLVFVYVSSPVMALEGAFEVADVVKSSPLDVWERFSNDSGLTKAEFDAYYAEKSVAFAIVIGRVWRIPIPINLAQLRSGPKGFHPPQSYHYISRKFFLDLSGFDTKATRN